MTKAFFKFDLSDPDDVREFNRMSKATKLAASLWDIIQRIRETEKNDKPHITLQEFYEILSDNDINLDELYR
jgi:hypothetical protein